MKPSKYRLIKAQGSFCPKCNKTPYLLSDLELKPNVAFYICFKCKFIGQVGIGEVRKI